ncbi:hypothetical protein ASC95_19115 [Pelomonas sp. Root1217]|uniref:hypothetical protein n=1 Tax=Pelomonas sp. Root1217 TaxID=1736430 RepID=UPI00071098E0|nr:hypothetical protein [Pelomonas sp. Root1217]KQV48083.1 hypothetical protein ASC95_19115 [Pelomonas sp. Root1217]
MGADAFIAFYGVKFGLDPDDEDGLDECDTGSDVRCQKARSAGLQTYTGRMTDGEDYFLYVGKKLASLGIEHDQYAAHSAEQLSSVAADVKAKLKAAGFPEPPAFHFQFIGQY